MTPSKSPFWWVSHSISDRKHQERTGWALSALLFLLFFEAISAPLGGAVESPPQKHALRRRWAFREPCRLAGSNLVGLPNRLWRQYGYGRVVLGDPVLLPRMVNQPQKQTGPGAQVIPHMYAKHTLVDAHWFGLCAALSFGAIASGPRREDFRHPRPGIKREVQGAQGSPSFWCQG